MVNHFQYGPLLQGELDYRRDRLRREVEQHRLAREARRAAHDSRHHVSHHAPAVRVVPADADAPTAAPADARATARRPGARAA